MKSISANEKIIVALDVGTTKVCTIISKVKNSEIEILGVGSHPSYGLKKGCVINIDKTVRSIRCSLEEAKLMSGVTNLESATIFCNSVTSADVNFFVCSPSKRAYLRPKREATPLSSTCRVNTGHLPIHGPRLKVMFTGITCSVVCLTDCMVSCPAFLVLSQLKRAKIGRTNKRNLFIIF